MSLKSWAWKEVEALEDWGPLKKGDVVMCTADLPEETGHDVFCIQYKDLLYSTTHNGKRHFKLVEITE